MNEPSKNSPIIEARNLHKMYTPRGASPIAVLQSVDLKVYPGDRIAIVGKSGAGKSTLLHILGTLEEPTSGDVSFLGQNVFDFPENKLSAFRNQQLGFVFQFHYLMLEFTALENVMMPAIIGGAPRKEAIDRARSLLSKVGLERRLSHKPNQLSGGEQQRVAIARALMKILLTDEMTGNLDPATGRQVFDLVQNIHSEFKLALISVTHDDEMAAAYPRIFELKLGKLLGVVDKEGPNETP
jgi:lipoprotein-releasing system ATP-binding protein